MKTIILIFVLVASIGLNCFAEDGSTSMTKSNDKKGEQLFIKNADECIAIIEQAAMQMPIQGAVVVAYIPGEITKSWVSKMKIVGRYTNENMNFLAVASSKIAEMATTLSTDKNSDRKLLKGEWGYQGKVLYKVKSGYLLAAFSGGSAKQDAQVAKLGLDWLAEKYE